MIFLQYLYYYVISSALVFFAERFLFSLSGSRFFHRSFCGLLYAVVEKGRAQSTVALLSPRRTTAVPIHGQWSEMMPSADRRGGAITRALSGDTFPSSAAATSPQLSTDKFLGSTNRNNVSNSCFRQPIINSDSPFI